MRRVCAAMSSVKTGSTRRRRARSAGLRRPQRRARDEQRVADEAAAPEREAVGESGLGRDRGEQLATRAPPRRPLSSRMARTRVPSSAGQAVGEPGEVVVEHARGDVDAEQQLVPVGACASPGRNRSVAGANGAMTSSGSTPRRRSSAMSAWCLRSATPGGGAQPLLRRRGRARSPRPSRAPRRTRAGCTRPGRGTAPGSGTSSVKSIRVRSVGATRGRSRGDSGRGTRRFDQITTDTAYPRLSGRLR